MLKDIYVLHDQFYPENISRDSLFQFTSPNYFHNITFILILYFLLYPILPVALTELPVGDIYAFMHFFYHVTYKAFWDNIYPDTVFCVWLNTSGLETNAEANHPIFKSKNSLVTKRVVFSFYLGVNKENNW